MWQNILKRYWMVTTLRESPECTPCSPFFLVAVTILFYIVVSFQWSLISPKVVDLPTSLFAGGLILSSYYLYTYAFLLMMGRRARLLQTLTCLLTSYLIIHLFAFPLIIMTQILVDEELNAGIMIGFLMIYFILAFVLALWQFLTTANIFRYALDLSFFNGILTCLGLMAFSFVILSLLQ